MDGKKLQSKFLELLNDSQQIISYHKETFQRIFEYNLDYDTIPEQLEHMLRKGHAGLKEYEKVLQNLKKVFQT